MNFYRPTSQTRPHHQRGFTLVELLVTLSVIAILIALAVPSFGESIRKWRRDSATKALVTDIQLARSEALKSSRKVSLCLSSDGSTCASTKDWKVGWLVFVDRNNNSTLDTGETIAVKGALSGIDSMTDIDDGIQLDFLPNGLMGSAATTITVTASGATSATKDNEIAISRVGRTTITQK